MFHSDAEARHYETISSHTESSSQKFDKFELTHYFGIFAWKISHTFKINVIHNIDELKQKTSGKHEWLRDVYT